MKRQTTGFLVLIPAFLLTACPAAAFTNNRYLAYGKKSEIVPLRIMDNYSINNSYISSLVTDDVNKLLAQGALKGQKGDKGDPGTSPSNSFGSLSPDDGVAAPAAITYNSNIPGNIAGFTELSAGDLTAGTSLTVSSGPVEISPAANLEVDGNANFTASTTMADLNVATIESHVSGANFDGYNWTNASSRALKENFGTVTPADILGKIDSLPIYTWNYKNESPNMIHIGPVAEDFYSAFALGNSSSSISTIDPAGVALAGIQALDQKVKALSIYLTTKSLEVGSGALPTGITIYDTVTKEPVCIFSANNLLESSPGQCATGAAPLLQANAVPDDSDPPVASSTPDSLDSTNASSSQGGITDIPPPINPSEPTSTIQSAQAEGTSSSTLSN